MGVTSVRLSNDVEAPLEHLVQESVKSGKLVDEDGVTQWLKSWGRKGEKAPPGV